MVVVTIELHGAVSGQKRHLGTMTISNDGTGSESVAHYAVTLSKWSQPRIPWRRGRVSHFKRKVLGPYDLVFLALEETVGDRIQRKPVPMVLYCPACGKQHLDQGEFAIRPHRTHRCENTPAGADGCGHEWRPASVPTVGVASLPEVPAP